jgi:hypothetical protein
MKYLCLIYDDESKRGTIPKEQMDTIMSEYYAFTESIKKGGQYIGGEALQPTQNATTIRVRQNNVSTTDGVPLPKRRNSSAASTSSTRKI